MSSANAPKSFMEKAKQAAITAAANTKAAAQVAAKQAERAKINQVTLPNAYWVLGKDIYTAGRFRDEFGDLYAKVDDTVGKIRAINQAAQNTPQPQSLTDKAKSAAGHAADLAKSKSLEVGANSLLRQLGHAAYEKHKGESGPQPLVDAIIEAVSDLAAIDADIQRLSGGGDARLRYNALVIGVSLFFCFPVGLYFVWTHPNWMSKTKWIWTGVWAAVVVLGMIAGSPKTEQNKHERSTASVLESNENYEGIPRREVERIRSIAHLIQRGASSKTVETLTANPHHSTDRFSAEGDRITNGAQPPGWFEVWTWKEKDGGKHGAFVCLSFKEGYLDRYADWETPIP